MTVAADITRVARAHAAVCASEGSTTAQIAAALGCSPTDARASLRNARQRGLVRNIRHPGVRDGSLARESVWYAVEPAQSHIPGIGARLRKLLVWHGLLGAKALVRMTGVASNSGDMLARLDTPDGPKQLMTRAVVVQAVRRMAGNLRRRADLLDEWADDVTNADVAQSR